jgi:thioredoxin reductase (NADPH)
MSPIPPSPDDPDIPPPVLDLAVVGAGPCGIAVGAAARRAGLDVLLLDRGCIASSIVGYPPYMTFFSTAEKLEVEEVPFPVPSGKPTRLDALTYYRGVVRYFGIPVRQYEEVLEIEREGEEFALRTLRMDGREHVVRARAVVVATGSFHAPNYLGVPGEHLPKLRHEYREPHPFYDQDVMVVGAGNSAVEAALELWRAGARVTLVHFGHELDRGVKPWVRPDIDNRLKKGEIQPLWGTRIREIRPASVVVEEEGTRTRREVKNDWIFALTGWRPDHFLLESLGVTVDRATGVPCHDPATLQTDVPGVYIAGVIAAGYDANRIFIENGREHGRLIVAHRLEAGRRPVRTPMTRR